MIQEIETARLTELKKTVKERSVMHKKNLARITAHATKKATKKDGTIVTVDKEKQLQTIVHDRDGVPTAEVDSIALTPAYVAGQLAINKALSERTVKDKSELQREKEIYQAKVVFINQQMIELDAVTVMLAETKTIIENHTIEISKLP